MPRTHPMIGVIATLLAACASSDSPPNRSPYATNTTTLIGGTDNPDGLAPYHAVTTPDGSTCINLDDVGVRSQTECGDDGAVDLLVEDSGAVVDVVCYPTGGVIVGTSREASRKPAMTS